MLRHVDLCSGIGGFALGLEWSGLSKPVLFCDNDKWCQKILAKHWPHVPIADDVKDIANEPRRFISEPIGILTAGYPCQPFSVAGKRQGEKDPRHIFPAILEIVAQTRPTFTVFENVYGHISMGLDKVLNGMESEGYAIKPFVVPACGVGALHRRNRLWLIGKNVADTNHAGSGTPEHEADKDWSQNVKGWEEQSQFEFGGHSEDVANANSFTEGKQSDRFGREQHDSKTEGQWAEERHRLTDRCWFWSTEPSICRVAHGIPRRLDRLRGLGNAIVPQIAMNIGIALKRTLEKST